MMRSADGANVAILLPTSYKATQQSFPMTVMTSKQTNGQGIYTSLRVAMLGYCEHGSNLADPSDIPTSLSNISLIA